MEGLLTYASGDSSHSDSDVSDRRAPGAKRQKSDCSPARPSLLPSAAALLDGSYSPPPAHQQQQLEQEALHQGRLRRFPHVTGNFATHVFVAGTTRPPLPCLPHSNRLMNTPPGSRESLETVLRLLRARLPDLQPTAVAASSSSGGGAAAAAAAPAGPLAQARYHVSLSRTVPLRLHQIEPLVRDLRMRLRQQETFCICMAGLEVFANDDCSRTFLALRAGVGAANPAPPSSSSRQAGRLQQQGGQQAGTGPAGYSAQLVALCQAVSQVFAAHGLPRFYDDPRPHASVAWLLGDRQRELEAALAAADVREAAGQLAAHPWQLRPAAIVCRAGQREHCVWPAAPMS